jgi:MSHA pilin protein MshD
MCIAEPRAHCHRPRAEQGISLIELIVFIVIVSVAVAAVLGTLSMATRASSDPMIQKQALAIAEALLEEVQLQPFTYCDPDDPNAATALDATGCTAGGAEAMGPEASAPYGPETRTSATTPFDNVNDYQVGGVSGPGLDINPITDLTGAAIAGLTGYSANIKVAAQALGTVSSSDSLLITVTVNGPPGSNTTVVLHGYRVRYAPNALP